MHSPLVEILKRLYKTGKVKPKKVAELQTAGKITEEESNFIIAPD
jgi:hypothetical protein